MRFKEEKEVCDEISQMVLDLEPDLFFAMHDNSADSSGFRRTDDYGYLYRERMAWGFMGQLACRLKTSRKKLKWLAVHEAGGKHGKLVQKDAGHLHIAIKLPPKLSADKEKVSKELKNFVADLAKKRGPVTVRWADICCTEFNRKDGEVFIQHLSAVATYMGMVENGLIDGEPFYKRPFTHEMKLPRTTTGVGRAAQN